LLLARYAKKFDQKKDRNLAAGTRNSCKFRADFRPEIAAPR